MAGTGVLTLEIDIKLVEEPGMLAASCSTALVLISPAFQSKMNVPNTRHPSAASVSLRMITPQSPALSLLHRRNEPTHVS
jgi:hypothetical protein